MGEKNKLIIGLFEEDPALSVLLYTLLTVAGHFVFLFSEKGEGLRAWLSSYCKPPSLFGLPSCDLLIVDIAKGAILLDREVCVLLEQINRQETPRLLLLTAGNLQDLQLPASVEVLPFRDVVQMSFLFQIIEHLTGASSPLSFTFLQHVRSSLREQVGEAFAAEQAWLDQRGVWLHQRQEWVTQRQSWIEQRREWLNQRTFEPSCQHEWLEEQYDWLSQQEREVSLQQTMVDDLRRWLLRSQAILTQKQQYLQKLQTSRLKEQLS